MFFPSRHPSPKVTVIGGGSWGTAIARLIALNLSRLSHAANPMQPRSPVPASFPRSNNNHLSPLRRPSSSNGSVHSPLKKNVEVPVVRMWLHEEIVQGERLTDIINHRHENTKYLPRISLPENLVATSNMEEAVVDSNVLIFAVPHQFLHNVLHSLTTLPTWQIPRETIAVSLIKGLEVSRDTTDANNPLILKPYSEIIQSSLSVDHVAVIMGANVAMDIAHDHFAETTLACHDLNVANYLATYLLRNDHFHVQITNDISTVEYCGALKNIVAIGAGFCDGMDLEVSTKAAVIRQGLEEMITFCDVFDRTGNFELRTMFLSCGVADLIATSFGGRNRKCAEAFARRRQSFVELPEADKQQLFAISPSASIDAHGERDREDLTGISVEKKPGLATKPSPTLISQLALSASSDSADFFNNERQAELRPDQSTRRIRNTDDIWREIEYDLLNGQKLQGVSTCEEVMHFLKLSGYLETYPAHFPLFKAIYKIVSEGDALDNLFHWR